VSVALQYPVAAAEGEMPAAASTAQVFRDVSWEIIAQSFCATQAEMEATMSARNFGNSAALALLQAFTQVC